MSAPKKYLDATGLSELVSKVKDHTKYGVFFADVSESSAPSLKMPAVWTATDGNVPSELVDGMAVVVKVPIDGDETYGTLLSINGEQHPVLVGVNTPIGVSYPIGTMLTLVYDAAQSGTYKTANVSHTVQGCWKAPEPSGWSSSINASEYNDETGEITIYYDESAITDITYNESTGYATFTY